MRAHKETKRAEFRPHLWDLERERRWRETFAGQKASGMSVRAFCTAKNISKTTFDYWQRTIRRRERAGLSLSSVQTETANSNPFVPVRVVAGTKAADTQTQVAIFLPGNAWLDVKYGTDLSLVAKLLQALEVEKC